MELKGTGLIKLSVQTLIKQINATNTLLHYLINNNIGEY